MKDILRFRGSLFNFYLTRVHKNANLPDPRRNETDPRVVDADPPPPRVSTRFTFKNVFQRLCLSFRRSSMYTAVPFSYLDRQL